MDFDFGSPDDSSDDGAVGNISAWQAGAKFQRSTPPQRSSGFQAVNQQPGTEDIAMKFTPELEPATAPQRQAAPVAHRQPVTEPTIISSGEDSSSDDEPEHAPDAPSVVAVDVEKEEDDIWAAVDEVVEDFVAVQEDDVPQLPQSMEDFQSGEGEEEQEDAMHDDDDESLPVAQLDVYIPRDELLEDDRADCVDLTAGSGAVRRVLDEREEHDGMMAYTVEFEDYHIKKVRLTCDFSCSKDPFTPRVCCLNPHHQHHKCCRSD